MTERSWGRRSVIAAILARPSRSSRSTLMRDLRRVLLHTPQGTLCPGEHLTCSTFVPRLSAIGCHYSIERATLRRAKHDPELPWLLCPRRIVQAYLVVKPYRGLGGLEFGHQAARESSGGWFPRPLDERLPTPTLMVTSTGERCQFVQLVLEAAYATLKANQLWKLHPLFIPMPLVQVAETNGSAG
jgi:hypothetical protein